MVRFLLRVLGLLLLAAGFVGLVVDATRSIVNETVSFTPLSELVATVLPRTYPTLQASVTQVHPALWDPVLVNLFQVPASVIGVVLGALLLWLGQKPAEPIGYLSGS
jgi:hypothetical protein